jgi:hypothetical protein
MAISTQYGTNPNFFGQEDYNEAIRQGHTPAEILQWMTANTDKLQGPNVPGGGGVFDNVLRSVIEEANNTQPASTVYRNSGINPQIIPLDITDQYDFTPRPRGSVSYAKDKKSWNINKEATDYKTNYRTDYSANRQSDFPTDARTNYVLPGFLPTNLPTDLPTTLRTDYRTDYPTDTQRKETYNEFVCYIKVFGACVYGDNVKKERWVNDSERNAANRQLNQTNAALNQSNAQTNTNNANQNTANYNQNLRNENANSQLQTIREKYTVLNTENSRTNAENYRINVENQKLNYQAQQLNQKHQELNDENLTVNSKNEALNKLYDKTIALASTTKGGDYVAQRDQIKYDDLIEAGFSPSEAKEITDNLKTEFKLFYQTEKLQPWDTSLGAKPPYGTFDPAYYKAQNPTVVAAWNQAVANDDLDITQRYGENNFYWQHYTTTGKNQGLRGNKEEDIVAANRYTEAALTDKEIQDIRDLQLGVNSDTITQRLLNIPEVTNEWTKARQGDPYWTKLAKEKYLDPNKAEDFAALFRLSERPEDKQVVLTYNVNAGTGITQLEDAINEAIGAKAQVDVKKFAALNQTILKDTIQQMKKVKAEQEMMSFYRGFSGFSEVMDINRELANSLLGDTGVGGILSYTSAGKAEEDLLGALQNVTGMRSNVAYNWQQWFDSAIKEKYGIDYSMFEPLEEKKDIITAFTSTTKKPFDAATGQFNAEFLKSAGFDTTEKLVTFLEGQGEEGKTILNTIKGDPGDGAKSILVPIQSRLEADIKTLDETKERGLAVAYQLGDKTEMMNIEAQFARNYIDEYLVPRFSTARSMDEFVEYLDVRQEEKNPFQTQDTYDAIKMLGELYSKKYLDDIKQQGPRSFDPNFYFNPTGDASRASDYAKQKQTVEEDWAKAKAGDPYWTSQAYRFGIDVNNKAAFARMHFEVKGQGQGYDAADDITNASKIKDYLYQTVIPVMKEEAFKSDTVFGQFITPEEFADEMLRGLDPAQTPDAWKELLQRYGIAEFAGTIDELKQYIVETLRTGSAQDIREQIKFLNEKRQKPTQEILGVTYIDRPEDYKDEMAKPTTELYAIFQKSGYQGTEDEFYTNMFPDLDRSEQVLLTKAGRDDALKTYGLDLSDPFASLGTIESFFPEDQKEVDEETAKTSAKDFYTSYFKIGEDDEEEPTKSNAGQAFLGEFTSMFKGL